MLFLHASTLGLSAALLFVIQPMVAKRFLATLGGSPQVWTTCCFFFQVLLLAGYSWAHLSTRWLSLRRQVLLHLTLLFSALLLPAPAGIDPADPAITHSPALWLLGRLALELGWPLVLVASTAPILQRWFSRGRHRAAKDPYFLYAASNAGSLGALLAYPLLIEPQWTGSQQLHGWWIGYGLLGAGLLACAFGLGPAEASDEEAAPVSPPTGRDHLYWIVCSFLPASLLLGVTTHLTTNISPVPMLWVIPMSLYLLSFILAYSSSGVSLATIARGQSWVLAPLLVIFFTRGSAWMLSLHLAGFFLTALLCHRRLAISRPAPEQLTAYYLAIAAGGLLGGFFNSILAPGIFSDPAEYPLVLLLACLARPPLEGDNRLELATGMALAVLSVPGTLYLLSIAPDRAWTILVTVSLTVGSVFVTALRREPMLHGLTVGLVLFAGRMHNRSPQPVLHEGRSFFGIHRVLEDPQEGYRVFHHGNTLHGAQSLDPARARTPTTYFHPTGPVGEIFSSGVARRPGLEVGVVGLGVGTLVTYGTKDQRYTVFEIDPAIVQVASNPAWFTYLRDSACALRVITGDARLTLARELPGSFDILVMDAFSSDSLPTHLITREAVALQRSRLRPRGVLLFNVTNRYLDLEPVLASIADTLGLSSLTRAELTVAPLQEPEKCPSHWVALAGTKADLAAWNVAPPSWRPLRRRPGMAPWTDDHSSILPLLKTRVSLPAAGTSSGTGRH